MVEKVKLSFISKEDLDKIRAEARESIMRMHEKKRKNKKQNNTSSGAAQNSIVKTQKIYTKRKSANKRRADESGYEKYSGIMPGGDSGREPRKQDWNDEIARNFQKELRKMRNERKQSGLNGVDRGALK